MVLRCFILPVAFVIISACVNINVNLSSDSDDTPRVKIKDVRFEVEVADTPQLRDRGFVRPSIYGGA